MNLRRYIGIPYASRQATFEGVDCYGLAVLFNKVELGIEIPTFRELYKDADDFEDATQAFAKGRQNWIKVDDAPKMGDVILLKQRGIVSHAGVYLDGIDFLHSVKDQASCLVSMTDFNWAKRMDGIMRWN